MRFSIRGGEVVLRWLKRLTPRERGLALLSVVALAGGLVWGGSTLARRLTTTVPSRGGTLRLGMTGQPRFVLPILAQTNDVDMDLARLLYNGLLTVKDGTLQGDLAESVEVSPDAKTYTAKLKPNVRWHDGEPFTAQDVLLTVRLIQDPAVKSPIATRFQGVAVTAPDEHTVRFSLAEPYVPFLASLQTGILPAHVWQEIPPQNVALSEHALRPIGTGPFRFEKLKKAEFSGEVREYQLARNEAYHGPPIPLAVLQARFFPTTDDLVRALRRGEIDSASYLPPSVIRDVEKLASIRVKRLRLPQYFAVFMNQARSAPLADPAVRRALTASVDRDALIGEALLGEGVRAETPIPPGLLGHHPDLVAAELNVERARDNLTEAGWTDENGDGLREKKGVALRFVLVTTDWPEYVTTAKLLAEQWRALGAEITVQPSSVSALQADILRPRDYEALLYGQVLGADPDPYPFWHSTQTRDPGLNLSLFKDAVADKLLEDARRNPDQAQRQKLYRTFQERLIETAPAIFLYSPTYAYAVPKRMEGLFLESAPLPADRFATIHTWQVKRKRVWRTGS